MQKKRISIWVALVIIMVLLSLLAIYFQDAPLNASTGATVSEESSATSSEPTYDLFEFIDEEHFYSIQIPTDWTRVTKDGFNTFVHSPSATSLQIQTIEYSPEFLLISQQSVASELSHLGYKLNSFAWISNTTYTMVYSSGEGADQTVYAESTYFDRKDAIRLAFTVNGEYANDVLNLISTVLDSFEWTPQNPFPKSMKVYYSRNGKYEFVYPNNWYTAVSGNTYVAQDPNSGMMMSVSAEESTANYKNLTKVDYANFAKQGRLNFVLRNYNATDTMIYAESTYIVNNTNIVLIQYLIANGSHEYTLTFEVPQIYLSEYSALIQEMVNNFRIF